VDISVDFRPVMDFCGFSDFVDFCGFFKVLTWIFHSGKMATLSDRAQMSLLSVEQFLTFFCGYNVPLIQRTVFYGP